MLQARAVGGGDRIEVGTLPSLCIVPLGGEQGLALKPVKCRKRGSAQKTEAARAKAFSMRMNRWRVAALFASRTWVTPPGRTRSAARWKTSKRNVWNRLKQMEHGVFSTGKSPLTRACKSSFLCLTRKGLSLWTVEG
jgi:hypothetical protein